MDIARADNFHSRLVFWLKVLMPLAALALLATLFLFGRRVSPEDAIPYASGTIGEKAKEPRLTDAVYAGMTTDGAALTIKAVEALPGVAGSSNAGFATDLTALLEMPGGSTAAMTSGTARLDQVAQQALLNTGVVLTSSTGYVIKTDGMSLGLNQTDVTSLAPITGAGPLGTISAQTMHLGRDALGGYVMDFTGDVRVVYTPRGGL